MVWFGLVWFGLVWLLIVVDIGSLARAATESWIKDVNERIAVEQAIYTVRNYVANSLAQID
jgi:hypothetical protein